MSKLISLTKGHAAIVDDDDYDCLVQYKWTVTSTFYAVRSVLGKQILMHRVIMNAPQGMVVDHINHNRLDNRRENLRVVTQAENARNKSKVSPYPTYAMYLNGGATAEADAIAEYLKPLVGGKMSRSAVVRRAIHDLFLSVCPPKKTVDAEQAEAA